MKDKYNLTLEQNIFLAKKVLVSNIYNSAKLEGLNVTYPDTKTILDGVNVPNVKLDDITCILNLRDAWKYVINTILEPVSLHLLCEINGFVSRNESLEWGKLRSGRVGISGTDFIPPIPNQEKTNTELIKLLRISNTTLRAIQMMLYGMRNQLFWDGNKRTSMITANKIMILEGKGVITVEEKNIVIFNQLLTHFYNTNESQEIVDFIYEHCIFGIDFIE